MPGQFKRGIQLKSWIEPPPPVCRPFGYEPVRNRTLPEGRQWTGRDAPGGQAAQRRLRQMARNAEKANRRAGAVTASGSTSLPAELPVESGQE